MEFKPETDTRDDGFYPIEENDFLKCLCGTELIKEDENKYRCPAGNVTYKIDYGSLIIDKFGNILIKKGEEHGN